MELCSRYYKKFKSKRYYIYNNSNEPIHLPSGFKKPIFNAWESIIVDEQEFMYYGYLDRMLGLTLEYFALEGV